MVSVIVDMNVLEIVVGNGDCVVDQKGGVDIEWRCEKAVGDGVVGGFSVERVSSGNGGGAAHSDVDE